MHGTLKWRSRFASIGLLAAALAAQVQAQAPAPPRTINDITVLLDQYTPDEAQLAKRRAAARQALPDGLNANEKVNFYLNRAHAAQEIGDALQQVADYRKALEFALPSQSYLGGYFDRTRILRELADAEGLSGNVLNALKLRLESLEAIGSGVRGTKNSAFGAIARYYANLGDFASTERYLAEQERNYRALMAGRDARTWGPDWTASRDLTRAEFLIDKGRYAEAEPVLRQSMAQYQTSLPLTRAARARGENAPSEVTLMRFGDAIERVLALVLSKQNQLADAEWHLRNVLRRTLERHGKYAIETARATQGLANLMYEGGRFADAERLSQATLEIYARVGVATTSWPYLLSYRGWIRNLGAMDRWSDALAARGKLSAGLASEPALQARFARHDAGTVYALIKTGKTADALAQLEELYRASVEQIGADHVESALLRGYKGSALAAGGHRNAALAEFRAAAAVLLAQPAGTRTPAQMRHLVRILEDYLATLAVAPDEASIGEAFGVAEAARDQGVQRAVAASAVRAKVADPALAALIRKGQDLQNEHDALSLILQRLLAAAPDQQLPKVMNDMRARMAQIVQERAGFIVDIEKRFPDYANLVNPKPPTLEDTRRSLRAGEVLLVVYSGGEKTFVWAVPQAGAARFAAVPLTRDTLAADVSRLRRALDPFSVGLPDVPPFDAALAHALYLKILAPVASAWSGATHLLVAAGGPLAQLPAALLPTAAAGTRTSTVPVFAEYRDVPWLIRSLAVTQLPSANSLVALRALPARAPGRITFAGFGDPYFNKTQAERADGGTLVMAVRGVPVRMRNPAQTGNVDSSELARLSRLPDTADEIRGIAAALGAGAEDVYLNLRANEREVKTRDLRDRRVIAFATHGLVPGELDGLTQPALALTAPDVAGVEGDGLLTMEEVLGLKLDADWVILSACNSASGDGAGAEAVSGLGRAFFYAGTRALLVSNWPVETVSAKLITTGIFNRQAADPALTRAQALRQTMLDLIDTGVATGPDGKQAYSFAHPLFWAPFSLVGDGG